MAEPQKRAVFVGLGNPGKKYAHTRHNYGFMVVEELARTLHWPLQEEKRFSALTAKGVVNETEVHLLLPMAYMNVSGWSVKQYLDYYKLTPEGVVVVCDDTALDFGQLRLRAQGSAGGHNGLKNIAFYLGTEEFARLRMGIGSRGEGQPLADYVLSEFTAEEKGVLDGYVRTGAEILKLLTAMPLTRVMSMVNT